MLAAAEFEPDRYLAGRHKRDAVVAIVDHGVLQQRVEPTVDIDAVRIPGEVGRAQREARHPRADIAIQPHEAGRRVLEGERAADREALHALKVRQLRPPAVGARAVEACAQPPARRVPIGTPIDGAAAREGYIAKADLVALCGGVRVWMHGAAALGARTGRDERAPRLWTRLLVVRLRQHR